MFPGPKFVDLVALWPESGELPRVAKLAGEKSWLVFHQLKMSGQDMMWLNEEVENWTRTRGYNRFSPYVTGTTVINDPGERALGVMKVTNKINSLKMGHVLELNATSDYFNFSILSQQGRDGSFCTASARKWQSVHGMDSDLADMKKHLA